MVETNNECLTSSEETVLDACVSHGAVTTVAPSRNEMPGFLSVVRALSALIYVQVGQKMHFFAF